MNMGTYSNEVANRISIDGVTYDISNLVLKSNVSATTEKKIYPTHLLSSQDDNEIELDESHHLRNSAAKQTSLYPSESLGLDNVFKNSSHHRREERSSARSSDSSMYDAPMSSSRVMNERSQRGSYESTQSRQNGERRGMLSYSPDDDDDSICGGQDPVRNSYSSSRASPRGIVNKSSSSYQRDAWGQDIPLKTPYDDDVDRVSSADTAASSDKLAQFLQYNQRQNSDSDTSMGMESLMIEIMPGLSEPLRGSAETIKAHMSGDIMKIHCVCCDTDISCVGDAAYVLCPNCTVVSPAPSESANGRSSWGVGLGFLADQFQVDDGMLSRSSSAVDPACTTNY